MNYIKDIFDQTGIISNAADKLFAIANAFHTTGNHEMYNKLCKLAYDIDNAQDEIISIIGKEVNQTYNESCKAFDDTMKTVINNLDK